MLGPDIALIGVNTSVNSVEANVPFTYASILPRAGEAAGILDTTVFLGAAGGELAYRLGPILNGSDAALRQGDAVLGGVILGLFVGTLFVGGLVLDNMDRQIQVLPT